jgi:adenylyltransferase/sulfurtransferase
LPSSIEENTMLTPDQKQRYARQIILPDIGEAGQETLLKSRVLIAGAGGLGSLSSLYMAAAGVGTLRIADKDTVSLSDLNRQILYAESDIGRVKVEAAAARLSAFNGSCRIEPLNADIRTEAEALVDGCDLVIDAVDNVPARRALNRAAVKLGVPLVHGGIDGFSGTVAVIVPGKSACFECLFPDRGAERPPVAVAALAPVVGLVASLQCAEAIKLLLSAGKPLVDRMLVIRVDTGEFRSIATRRNPDCALCAGL